VVEEHIYLDDLGTNADAFGLDFALEGFHMLFPPVE
jgi:hypothetical protein